MHVPTPAISYVISFRVTPEERRKLRALCEHTHRTPSDLLRLMIRLAQMTEQPLLPLVLRGGEMEEMRG